MRIIIWPVITYAPLSPLVERNIENIDLVSHLASSIDVERNLITTDVDVAAICDVEYSLL